MQPLMCVRAKPKENVKQPENSRVTRVSRVFSIIALGVVSIFQLKGTMGWLRRQVRYSYLLSVRIHLTGRHVRLKQMCQSPYARQEEA